MLTLVTGGARSGKSRFAQSLCLPNRPTAFLATAQIGDDEMRERVRRHRAERPPQWITVEEPLRISDAAAAVRGKVDTVLVDCLTMWASNSLFAAPDPAEQRVEEAAFRELDALIAQAEHTRLLLVTNEVGLGIVPDSALGRRFRDLQGWINQRVAARADEVYLMVSGIPLRIKHSGREH
jgi:adenosylcobinamide kinase/adenosylcobinamide-phosphate guanylyltransferase